MAVGAAIVWPRGPELYTAGAAGAQVTLADGSRIEMRAQAELTVEREDDGLGIRLRSGDIIVSAAKQRDGHLYVHTKDMTIAVVGTVFLVNAGSDGSRVAVIEGEVRVRERGTPPTRSGRQGDVETRLRPGEQVTTSPTIARRPLTEDITWSRNANAHLAILDSFMKGMAQTASGPSPVPLPEQAAAVGRSDGKHRVRRSLDSRVQSRQPAAGTGRRARRRREQSADDARPPATPCA